MSTATIDSVVELMEKLTPPQQTEVLTILEEFVRASHPSDSVVEAIKVGVADIEAGRVKPADQFFDEFFRKYNISVER